MQNIPTCQIYVLLLIIANFSVSYCDDVNDHVKKLQNAGNLIKKGTNELNCMFIVQGQTQEALQVLHEVGESSHAELASSALNNIGSIHMNNGIL